MSEFGLFWDSRNGDRVYSASSFEEWLKKFFTTGVFNQELFVESAGGMGLTVSAGYCNINGKVMFFEDEQTFTLEASYPEADRIDAVVIERNDTDRAFTMKVVKGNTDGVAPLPTRESGVYQLVLAYIAIEAGATSVSQADITDTRMDDDLCGWVATTVTEIEFDQIYAEFRQWMVEKQQSFMDWFQHLVYVLDGDVAGHLQNEIEDLQSQINDNYDTLDRKKENLKRWVSVVLTVDGWVTDPLNESYKIYSLESLYSSSEYDIVDVTINSLTNRSMRWAWSKAICGGYDDRNVIVCRGDAPEIDIALSICVRKKVASPIY